MDKRNYLEKVVGIAAGRVKELSELQVSRIWNFAAEWQSETKAKIEVELDKRGVTVEKKRPTKADLVFALVDDEVRKATAGAPPASELITLRQAMVMANGAADMIGQTTSVQDRERLAQMFVDAGVRHVGDKLDMSDENQKKLTDVLTRWKQSLAPVIPTPKKVVVSPRRRTAPPSQARVRSPVRSPTRTPPRARSPTRSRSPTRTLPPNVNMSASDLRSLKELETDTMTVSELTQLAQLYTVEKSMQKEMGRTDAQVIEEVKKQWHARTSAPSPKRGPATTSPRRRRATAAPSVTSPASRSVGSPASPVVTWAPTTLESGSTATLELETVTPRHLRQALTQPENVDAIRVHMREVFKWKLGRYQTIATELTERKNVIEEKSRQMGLTPHDRDKQFPEYVDLFGLLFEVNALIGKLGDRVTTYASESENPHVKRRFETALSSLEEILGDARAPIRNYIARMLYTLIHGPEGWINNFNNFALLGDPGTGKTSAAMTLAKALGESGILMNGTAKIVSRPDLVAQYLGQTAMRTRAALLSHLDGIVFIDEAYSLTDQFGIEALTEIVNITDKYVGLLTLGAGGYTAQMREVFFGFNPGMPRRFPNVFELPHYSTEDLINLFFRMISLKFEREDVFTARGQKMVEKIIALLDSEEVFTNQAGDIMNAASFMTQHIIGSVTPWGVDVPLKIISAFNQFLASKGVTRRLAVPDGEGLGKGESLR